MFIYNFCFKTVDDAIADKKVIILNIWKFIIISYVYLRIKLVLTNTQHNKPFCIKKEFASKFNNAFALHTIHVRVNMTLFEIQSYAAWLAQVHT